MNNLENKTVKIIMEDLNNAMGKISEIELVCMENPGNAVAVVRKKLDELTSNELHKIHEWLFALSENKTK